MEGVMDCRSCGARGPSARHTVREMNFGTREEFDYLACRACGSLQIAIVPADLARHYPRDYLGADAAPIARSRLKAALSLQKTRYMMGAPNPIGWALSRRSPDDLAPHLRALGRLNPRRGARILDIGCGPGRLLNRLSEAGFTNLVGQDAFQQWTLPGFKYETRPISKLPGKFDVVMMHHSLEHMEDLVGALQAVRGVTASVGHVLIRIPVAGGEAWDRSGANWYQIDAPRHLNIPSLAGMKALAGRAGLDLVRVEFDSDETQFLCSRQYANDIPLRDDRSYYHRSDQTLFTQADVRAAKADASVANRAARGDQACFYLRPRTG